jgi:hypothetical protein
MSTHTRSSATHRTSITMRHARVAGGQREVAATSSAAVATLLTASARGAKNGRRSASNSSHISRTFDSAQIASNASITAISRSVRRSEVRGIRSGHLSRYDPRLLRRSACTHSARPMTTRCKCGWLLCAPAPCQNPDCTTATRRKRPYFSPPVRHQRSTGRVSALRHADQMTVYSLRTQATPATDGLEDVIDEISTEAVDDDTLILAGYALYRLAHPKSK